MCLSNTKDKVCTDLNYRVLYSAYKNQYDVVKPPAVILPDSSVVFLILNTEKCVDTPVELWVRDADGKPAYNADGTPKIVVSVRNSCGIIVFDVNGAKGPNKYGYDAFGVSVWSSRIGQPYWAVYGTNSLFSILSGGKLKYNTNK